MNTEELSNSNRFQILDEIPAGKFVIDRELTVVFWNSTMERWTGLKRKEMLGTDLKERYPHLKSPRFNVRIQDVFEMGTPALYTPAINQHFIPIQQPRQGLMMQEAQVTRIHQYTDLALVSIQDCNTQYAQLNNLREQIRQRRLIEQSLTERNRILNSVRKFQTQFIQTNHKSSVFQEILNEFIELTGSQLAFLGLVSGASEQFDVRVQAISHTELPPHVLEYLKRAEDSPLSFKNKNSLIAKVVESGQSLTSNDPSKDTRGAGLPSDHPMLSSFMGLPLRLNDETIGIIGLANAQTGYTDDQAATLEPMLTATAQFIKAREGDRERAQMMKQLKEHAEELEKAKLTAENAAKVKAEFLANMSHEIRTPMTAILGYTEILQDPDSDEETSHRAVQTIHRNGEHLLCLINDILDISKIESGHMTMEMIPSNVKDIVDDVVDMLSNRAADKGIQLDAFYKNDVPSQVVTDPTRLHQILLNLAGNAIKFTQEGFVRIQVRMVKEDNSEPCIAFDVTDTGIGIPEDKLGALFDAFTQADNSTTRQFGGTGLGLAISKKLCFGLGGELTVTSKPGFGSTFTAKIAAKAVIDEEEEVCQTVVSNAVTKTESPKQEAGARKILIADDAEDNRKLIEFFLKKEDCTTTFVENGELALQAAVEAHEQAEPYDLILLDMQMPVRDGYSTAEELKRRQIPTYIVALTANAMSSDREKCLNAGCDDYLSKPINRAALIEKVRNFQPVSQTEIPQAELSPV